MKNETLLILAVALATAVEMVEALTIVLAVGVTRGWRATLAGVGAALVVLGAVVAAVGPPISHLSLTPLRLIVGRLLLIFGLQWLRKAMLRLSGYKAMHDEEVIYDSGAGLRYRDTPRSILRRLLVRHCLQGCIRWRASRSSSSFSPSGHPNIGWL